ncbi:TFIIH/NER complex subunit [Saxophila tyrrhenica]|uniref:RNA polymerase II transcription factor B subunit 3 n=1 Tax=Saxophila tyrrhenica TaxID=1690608 RepID=A0AAV9P370_9PEZI|nr:TFIIH/NER complex subunit [Saxophila tyrrhenica]
MSRQAQSRPQPTTRRPADSEGQDEICPVCKSSRYLTPTLRFLINPECYHKFCESCVDRIFSHGPAPCPIPGCHKTLRKHKFRTPTFSDLQVEREVDIRKKVGAVFNRREEEFEDLRAYNDYLNEVEDITFNLINKLEVEETEKRFKAYQRAHEREITENASLAEQERASFAALQKEEREQARSRREAARREDAEEKRQLEENRRDVLNRLASGQDAESVAKAGQQVHLKKRMDRAAAAERQRQLQAASASNGSGNVVIKGLRAKQKQEPEASVDPFGGLSFEGRKYYALQDDYVWAGVQETKADVLIGAGGYDVGAFTGRALCEAFAGLGVFVGDEMDERDREKMGKENDEMATKGAEVAATKGGNAAKGKVKDVKMEDPF